MKINNIQNQKADFNKLGIVEKHDLVSDEKVFMRQLSSLTRENYEVHVKDLIDSINKQGRILSERANMSELQKYRTLITQLLNETVSNGYAFNKSNSLDSRGRHRVFAMVDKINKKLDEITQDILKEQADEISLLNQVDDIRGMLVDIYL